MLPTMERGMGTGRIIPETVTMGIMVTVMETKEITVIAGIMAILEAETPPIPEEARTRAGS